MDSEILDLLFPTQNQVENPISPLINRPMLLVIQELVLWLIPNMAEVMLPIDREGIPLKIDSEAGVGLFNLEVVLVKIEDLIGLKAEKLNFLAI